LIKRHTTYFESLSGLSSSYVVLYDTLDHRAWLSNGLHTLLHLVRASLWEDQRGDFSDECLLSYAELEEDTFLGVDNPNAAIRFLKNRNNLEQPVFPGLDEIRTEHTTVPGGQTTTTQHRTSTTVRLKDRVNQIMDVLWQLIDHQATLDVLTSAVPIRLPRSKLEGFRFMEVATRRAMTPRVVHLGAFDGAGKSWVDFVRAIRAVTLFGEGFGDLIMAEMNRTTSVCSHWWNLPKGKDYLAVSGYDLERIIRQEGSASCNPIKLAPDIFWNYSDKALTACECEGRSNKGKAPAHTFRPSILLHRRCDRVQVLLPGKLAITRRNPTNSAGCITADSAFIFGRTELFPWRWPDQGEPKQEDPSEGTASTSGNSGGNLLSAISTSTSSTRSPSMSGHSRGAASASLSPPTTVSSPPSSQGEAGNPGPRLETQQGGPSSDRKLRRMRNFFRKP